MIATDLHSFCEEEDQAAFEADIESLANFINNFGKDYQLCLTCGEDLTSKDQLSTSFSVTKKVLKEVCIKSVLEINIEEDSFDESFPFCQKCVESKVSKLHDLYRQLQIIQEQFDSIRGNIVQGIIKAFVTFHDQEGRDEAKLFECWKRRAGYPQEDEETDSDEIKLEEIRESDTIPNVDLSVIKIENDESSNLFDVQKDSDNFSISKDISFDQNLLIPEVQIENYQIEQEQKISESSSFQTEDSDAIETDFQDNNNYSEEIRTSPSLSPTQDFNAIENAEQIVENNKKEPAEKWPESPKALDIVSCETSFIQNEECNQLDEKEEFVTSSAPVEIEFNNGSDSDQRASSSLSLKDPLEPLEEVNACQETETEQEQLSEVAIDAVAVELESISLHCNERKSKTQAVIEIRKILQQEHPLLVDAPVQQQSSTKNKQQKSQSKNLPQKSNISTSLKTPTKHDKPDSLSIRALVKQLFSKPPRDRKKESMPKPSSEVSLKKQVSSNSINSSSRSSIRLSSEKDNKQIADKSLNTSETHDKNANNTQTTLKKNQIILEKESRIRKSTSERQSLRKRKMPEFVTPNDLEWGSDDENEELFCEPKPSSILKTAKKVKLNTTKVLIVEKHVGSMNKEKVRGRPLLTKKPDDKNKCKPKWTRRLYTSSKSKPPKHNFVIDNDLTMPTDAYVHEFSRFLSVTVRSLLNDIDIDAEPEDAIVNSFLSPNQYLFNGLHSHLL